MSRYGFALLLFCFALPAHAGDSFSIGTENYQWSEYRSDGFRLLTESGQRHSVGYTTTRYLGHTATLFNMRYYFGDVFYDGYLQDSYGNIIAPYTSTTGYTGFSLERKRLSYSVEDLAGYGEVGFGMDYWQRVLDKGGVHGYTENYLALFLRAGLGRGEIDAGWHGNFGIKFPLIITETVQAYPYDPIRLSPTPSLSFYAEAGYGTRGWGWALFYDAYNFEASPVVPVTSGGYYTGSGAQQPKSVTDRLGLRISMHY